MRAAGYYRSVTGGCEACPAGLPWTVFVGPMLVMALFGIYYQVQTREDGDGGACVRA